MSIPLPTTTISIYRPASYADAAPDDQLDWKDPWGDDDEVFQLVAKGIPAHLHAWKGKANRDGGNFPHGYRTMTANECDLRKDDRVLDEVTGLTWLVDWVLPRVMTNPALTPLNRVDAQLNRIDGATPGNRA